MPCTEVRIFFVILSIYYVMTKNKSTDTNITGSSPALGSDDPSMEELKNQVQVSMKQIMAMEKEITALRGIIIKLASKL